LLGSVNTNRNKEQASFVPNQEVQM